MGPVTMNRPKMLLPLGERPVIGRFFAELETDDRINNIYVSNNSGSPRSLSTLSPPVNHPSATQRQGKASEHEKLGVGDTLAPLVDRKGIDDDLLVVAGDNFVSFAMSDQRGVCGANDVASEADRRGAKLGLPLSWLHDTAFTVQALYEAKASVDTDWLVE